MKALTLRRIFPENWIPNRFNIINPTMMPDVEKYWLSKGRFDKQRYNRFLAIRNTDIVHNTENGDFQISYDHVTEKFEISQGFVSSDKLVSRLGKPITVNLETAEKLLETMLNIKNRQK
jgi:hypothetical protein